MDLTEKRLSLENMHDTWPSKSNMLKKSCIDCHTTRTPCWRGGPAGPRTLCNACGIRYRKQRRALQEMGKEEAKPSKRKKDRNSSSSRVALKMGLMGLGRNRLLLLLQEEWKRKLGEEEEAAILLMALSCGSVYA